MKFKANGDIDLSDPQTIEELKGGDVITTKIDKEAEATDTPDTTAENKESSDSDSKKEDAKV